MYNNDDNNNDNDIAAGLRQSAARLPARLHEKAEPLFGQGQRWS